MKMNQVHGMDAVMAHRMRHRAMLCEPALERVREFHLAFGAHIAERPRMPELSIDDARVVEGVTEDLASIGRRLRALAAFANGKDRTSLGLALVRLQLLVEETAELGKALATEDLVEALDALSDITYVTNGTYLTLGLDQHKEAADQEVHASNMSKLGEDGQPIIEPSGRVVKGPHYRKPDLRRVLGKHAPK